jgi:branched-chain amino acid transport system substrate-binding protein
MRLRSVLVHPFIFLLLCGCGPKGEEEPTWIGLVASLDGAPGGRFRQGVELAVGDSSEVRVEGRRLAVLSVNDNGSDEAAAAEGVRLLSVNQVAALIGGPDAGRSLALARAAQAKGAPVVLPCEVAGPPPGNAVFALGVRPGWRGQVLARHACQELKGKHAVIITDEREPISMELANAFAAEWPREAGTPAEWEAYRSDADLSDRVDLAAGSRPDVVLIATSAADFLKARARLESAQPRPALLYGGPDVGAGPLAGGRGDVYTATVFTPDGLTDRGKEVAGKYQDRFREAPDLLAAEGYEAARVLFDAMARAKAVAADKVRERLAGEEFDGLTGPLRFKDGRARRRVFVVALHDGEAKPAATIEPEEDAPAAAK